jgi:hypothetical protein
MAFLIGFIAGVVAASAGFMAIKNCHEGFFYLPSCRMDEWF